MAAPFSALLFAALLIPPGPAYRHLTLDNIVYRPIKATLLPSAAFSNLPPHAYGRMELARGIERLAWSWALLYALGSIWRTVARLRRGRAGEPATEEGLRAHSILEVRPIWRTIATHLLAWRLGSMQNRELFNYRGYHLDLVGLLGILAGLTCFWGEVGRMARLFGWKRDPGSGPSWTLSIVHVLFSGVRLVLSWTILVAAMGLVQLPYQK